MAAQQKKILRGEMRKVLENLDERWLKAASKDLGERLSSLIESQVGSQAKHVLAWSAFFPGEVDLTSFIDRELDRRTVYLPRVLADSSMTFVAVTRESLSEMVVSSTGLAEPLGDNLYDPDMALETVVLAPGLAFGKDGRRLGRGKGCYDRFLARSSMMRALRIGVCWSLQLRADIPVDSHDVPMDWICHEEEYFRIGIDPE